MIADRTLTDTRAYVLAAMVREDEVQVTRCQRWPSVSKPSSVPLDPVRSAQDRRVVDQRFLPAALFEP